MTLAMNNEQLLKEVQHFDFVDALRGWAFLAVGTFFKLAMTHHWPFWPDFYFIALYLSALAGTLCVSTLTYEWIETPFQGLGKRINHRDL